jgi:hypothetical protein
MRLPTVALTLAACLIANAAQAHARLEKSTPAEGSTLTAAPTTLEMTFTEPARLTALSIQRNHEARHAIKELPTAAERTQRVTFPTLAAGAYTLTWRVVAADGHISSGDLHFTVAPGVR